MDKSPFQDPEKEINILIEMRKNLLKNINKKKCY